MRDDSTCHERHIHRFLLGPSLLLFVVRLRLQRIGYSIVLSEKCRMNKMKVIVPSDPSGFQTIRHISGIYTERKISVSSNMILFSSSRHCIVLPCLCGCYMFRYRQFERGHCQIEGKAYHQMLKGSSKRVIRIPWSILRALSPRACFPAIGREMNM